MLHITLLKRSKIFCKHGIVDSKCYFKVQVQASRIQIKRTEQADVAINRNGLGVEQSAFEFHYPDSRIGEISLKCLARQVSKRAHF